MMMFKTWGYITMAQALTFASDFKLGHYMKIPPRPMFWAQVVATVIAGTVQLGVQAWMFTNIPDMCSPDQPNGFIVSPVLSSLENLAQTERYGVSVPIHPSVRNRVHHLGCHRPRTPVLQGPDLLVRASLPLLPSCPQCASANVDTHPSGLVFFFLAGALAPLGGYLITLKWPNSFFKYVNFPVIFSGTGLIPPATASNYVPWAIVGFIFNYLIRRRHFSWWTKYNCSSLLLGLFLLVIVARMLTSGYWRRRAVRGAGLGRGRVRDPDLLHPAVPG